MFLKVTFYTFIRSDELKYISYSHQDKALAEKICAVIQNLGLAPLWDEDFAAGQGFHDQIKRFIAHAHVVMPIITPASSDHGWVHQEIGYAVAMQIPVLPIAWGKRAVAQYI